MITWKYNEMYKKYYKKKILWRSKFILSLYNSWKFIYQMYICRIEERDYRGMYQKLVIGEADAHGAWDVSRLKQKTTAKKTVDARVTTDSSRPNDNI